MIDRFAEKSGKSLWKKLGERALKEAVSTFVSEGIEAVIELWKKRQLKELDLEFKEREKARKNEAGDPDDPDDEKGDDEDDSDAPDDEKGDDEDDEKDDEDPETSSFQW